MHEFARLYNELDATTATLGKLDALKRYFSQAQPANAAWAVYFLAGGKPRQIVSTKLLRQFSTEMSGFPEWLFDECYQAVGDFAETIAHILPPPRHVSSNSLSVWMEERIIPLRNERPERIRSALLGYWDELEAQERFLLIKLISGAFRVGVSKLLVIRALSELTGLDIKIIAQRMMGWTDSTVQPSAERYTLLISPELHGLQDGQPYPFFLAHPLQVDPQAHPQTLGDIRQWQIEWKYDGIRAQLVQRDGQRWLWSRGEDLITDRFPEISSVSLPDGTVMDGEIVIWKNDKPAPFSDLQKRIGRKTLSSKMLSEVPAVFMAFDLVEHEGRDIRNTIQSERRQILEEVVQRIEAPSLLLAPLIQANDWNALSTIRDSSRSRAVEGLMLKEINARYGMGRTKEHGIWWKWKIDPYSVDAVLIYAQPGHGRRASLFTDYTFAVWDKGAESGERDLVPFAKAYSGLTDREIAQVDAIIRKTTVEKFGPVRRVTPTMVFEIGFEGIAPSTRHKAGVAVRFPRMLRIRDDKKVSEADTLETLRAMLSDNATKRSDCNGRLNSSG